MSINYLNEYNLVVNELRDDRDTELTESQSQLLAADLLIENSSYYSGCLVSNKPIREQREYPQRFYYPLSKVLIIVQQGGHPKLRIGPCTEDFIFNSAEEDTHFGITYSTDSEIMGFALPLKKGKEIISGYRKK